MTPLSPAAQTCLRQLRELFRELDTLRGTHAQEQRIAIARKMQDVLDRFLKLTTH